MLDSISGQDYFAHTETQREIVHSIPFTQQTLVEAQAIIAQACRCAHSEIAVPRLHPASAVVISDLDAHDLPIVYTSPGFEDLTGYHETEVLGRNCRFLQQPDLVTPGRALEPLPAYNGYDQARDVLRQKIRNEEAVSLTIINYHKSGRAFLNGLTIIPVSYKQSRYYVGFLSDALLFHDAGNTGHTITLGKLMLNIDNTQDPGDSNSDNTSYTSPQLKLDTTPSSDRLFQHPPTISNTYHEMQTSPSSTKDWIESEPMLSALLKSPEQIVCVVSSSLQIHVASKAIISLIDSSYQNLHELSLLDIIHPNDVTAVENQLRKIAPGSSCNTICRVRKNDGDVVYIDFSVSKISSANRSPPYMILCGHELPTLMIPERILVEEKQNVYPPMWAKISTTGIILYGTSALQSLFQWQASADEHLETPEIIGLTFQSRMCPHSRTKFELALASVSMRRADLITVRHCFECSHGSKLVVSSDLIFPESHHEVKLNAPAAFVLLRVQYTASQPTRKSALVCRSSKKFLRNSSTQDCNRICIAMAAPSSSSISDSTNAKSKSKRIAQRHGSCTSSRAQISTPITVTPTVIAKATTTKMTENILPTNAVLEKEAAINLLMYGFDPPADLDPGSDAMSLQQEDMDACWQYNTHSLALANVQLRKELDELSAHNKMMRKRRTKTRQNGLSCANCHAIDTPEWRRGPSGQRDLCNRCGLKYFKDKRSQQQEDVISALTIGKISSGEVDVEMHENNNGENTTDHDDDDEEEEEEWQGFVD